MTRRAFALATLVTLPALAEKKKPKPTPKEAPKETPKPKPKPRGYDGPECY